MAQDLGRQHLDPALRCELPRDKEAREAFRRRHNTGPSDPRWERVASGLRTKKKGCSPIRPVEGARFSMLTVLKGIPDLDAYSLVRCDCGQERWVQNKTLRDGRVTSCKTCGKKRIGYGRATAHHFFEDPVVSNRWVHRYKQIMARCYNPNHPAYHNYGGRGITVHPEWTKDRQKFFKYVRALSRSCDPGLDLDRIDNEQGYVPGNLRLVSRKENARNRRGSRTILWRGREVPLHEFWETQCPNLPNSTLYFWVLHQGYDAIEILERYRRGGYGIRSGGRRA